MAQILETLQNKSIRLTFRGLGIFAPGLAAAWAKRMYFATHRFRETEHDARWRAQASQQLLHLNDDRIAVYRWGESDKPLILCLHGWNGHASQFSTMLPVLLKAGYQVVAFDAPGHGNSSGNMCNIFRYSAALQRVTTDIAPVYGVVTHSFGGMVAAYAIKQLGLSVRKLVMIASPISTHYLLDKFAESLKMNRRVLRKLEQGFRHEYGEDVFERISAEQNLRNCRLPVLLIHDKQDKSVSWRNSERIVAVAANATAIYTEGHGHRRLLRDKKLIRKIVDFMELAEDSA